MIRKQRPLLELFFRFFIDHHSLLIKKDTCKHWTIDQITPIRFSPMTTTVTTSERKLVAYTFVHLKEPSPANAPRLDEELARLMSGST